MENSIDLRAVPGRDIDRPSDEEPASRDCKRLLVC